MQLRLITSDVSGTRMVPGEHAVVWICMPDGERLKAEVTVAEAYSVGDAVNARRTKRRVRAA